MTDQSLYERLGDVNAIATVVDRFSDKTVENPKLNVNPQLREWNGKGFLPGLKFMRTLWLCAVAGGPFQYTGKELHEAHKDLRITSEEFDEVGAEIASALDSFHVPGPGNRQEGASPPGPCRRHWVCEGCWAAPGPKGGVPCGLDATSSSCSS